MYPVARIVADAPPEPPLCAGSVKIHFIFLHWRKMDFYLCMRSVKIFDNIRRRRIERARRLLTENENLSIREISEQCGFTDYNYFITVFKKYCGESPARYRKFG